MYSPKFTISSGILSSVGKIEASREVIDSAPLVPAWEKRFRDEAKIRIVHHGTHLEGNDLSYSEAERVIHGQEVTGKQRDVQEVINYREVMEYIDKIAGVGEEIKDGEGKGEFLPITEEMLKEVHRLTVHKLLDDEESGSYREVKVVIRNTTTGEITFRPPPPVEIPYLLSAFFHWLNSQKGRSVHPLLRAGILHYELVKAHPFTDGNGRTARAIALLLLFIEGYQVKRFFSLEEYYDSNPQDYYDALKSVEKKKGDLTDWLEYFTLGIAVEFSRVKDMVQKLSLDLKLKSTMGGRQIALSERQIKLIGYLERHGSMVMGEGKDVLPNVSDDTVLRDLRDLVKKELVTKKGKTKGVRYYLKHGGE